MTNSIDQLRETCKKISSSLNIHKYDVYGMKKEESSAGSKEKKPFALSAYHKNAVTLRIWNKENQVGITSTSNLTEEGIKTAFEIALNSALFFDKNMNYNFSPLCQEKINAEHSNQDQDFVSIQKLADAAVECENTILNSHPSIKSVPYNKVTQNFYEKFYFNSDNAFRHQTISSSFCYFFPLAQEENKVPRQLGHVTQAYYFKELDYSNCAKIALEKTIKYLNYEKVQSGNYTVVFAPEAFLDIVGAFANFFNAQNILDNKSLSTKETLNTKIAAENFNISDCPLHKDNIGAQFFDEEGTPTSEMAILENGVLKNLIHTSYTAEKFNTKPSGHTSIGAKLTAHPYFLKISSSKNATQTKPSSPKTFIYIEEVKALHAGINALQGSFSLPFDGFIVNQDKRVSIESATVAGDFLNLLKNIIYVSPEEKSTPAGVCAEEIWVESLSITGN